MQKNEQAATPEALMLNMSLLGMVSLEFTVVPTERGFRCVFQAHAHQGNGTLTLERYFGSLPQYASWVEANKNKLGMSVAMMCDSPHARAVALALDDLIVELRKGSPSQQRAAARAAAKLDAAVPKTPVPPPAPAAAAPVPCPVVDAPASMTMYSKEGGYREVDTSAGPRP